MAVSVKEQSRCDVDRRKIHLDEHIKSIGNYNVTFKLHPQVTAKLNIIVKAE